MSVLPPKINHFYFGNGPFFGYSSPKGKKVFKDVSGAAVLLQLLFSSSSRAELLEGFPLRMSGIDNSYKIDGDVLLVIHASIPPGVHRPTRTDRRRSARLQRRQHNSSWNYIGRRKPKIHSGG